MAFLLLSFMLHTLSSVVCVCVCVCVAEDEGGEADVGCGAQGILLCLESTSVKG